MRVLAIGMVALVVTATPASAQIVGSIRGLSGSPSVRGEIRRAPPADPTVAQSVSVSRSLHDVRNDIDAGRSAGQLTRSEARSLRRESYRIDAMRERFASGGYSAAEVALLNSRAEALRSAVVAKRSQGLAGK
jgi:hypothetical protein